MWKTCDTNLRERRYSVIEKHPYIKTTRLEQLSRLAVILNERFRPNKQRLSFISTNKKRKIQAQPKILNHKRHQLTRFAQTILSQAIAVSGNVPPQRHPRGEEVESRGWRRGAPQSSSSPSFGAPARSNKIYMSDLNSNRL